MLPLTLMAQSNLESLDDQVKRYQEEFQAKEIQRELQWQEYKQRELESQLEELERSRDSMNLQNENYLDLDSLELQEKSIYSLSN